MIREEAIREKAIRELKVKYLGDTDELRQAKDMGISALKGGWIPTIERMPEVGDTVLCSVKTPECTDHHIIICKYCAEEFWKNGTIRAWQPLPEPYKGESEGK